MGRDGYERTVQQLFDAGLTESVSTRAVEERYVFETDGAARIVRFGTINLVFFRVFAHYGNIKKIYVPPIAYSA
jgi:hypothetical protein